MSATEEKQHIPTNSPESNGILEPPQPLLTYKQPFERITEPTKPLDVVYRSPSHVSGPDVLGPSSIRPPTPPSNSGPHEEAGDEIYDRVSPHRKHVIVTILSFCAFLAPLSSTSVLAAVPQVAETYHTTGSIINVSNAAYMALMGISPVVWGPMSQVFGRRPVCLAISFFPFGWRSPLSRVSRCPLGNDRG
ncbi:hypothetical protein M431DRAFT_312954 [Trichoderma harzianum CBS 226.95]|uniref:Major facilitator superfamily (MFS) profile domain-containing protein n=1 Tax=Trichoderma harzianum CBS 226.95 TaxID=983964 RepID=A0A2T4ARL1_TRIHA|nr:hypothetical protein M431DRAFT_312954 [Trichoderma harzianum CBS 226.95]PTB59715.1 hypothetical protein M431DRAFT_312954 [Trichoderma harzianum CBS 226.95]